MTVHRMPVRFVTLVAAALLTLAASPASAQTTMSEERLKELIREAERAAQETRLFDTIRTPESGNRVALTLDEAVARALENNLDIKVQRLNPQARLITISSFTGEGMNTWADWLLTSSLCARTSHSPTQPIEECSGFWYG